MNEDFQLDLSSFPVELTALLSIISEKEDSLLVTHLRRFSDINWGQFIRLVMHHRLYPIVYLKLKKLDGVPSHVIQALHREYQINTFQMLQLSGEMEQVCKWLSQHNVRALLLKGPVLAADLYGDISLRASRDLDMLIPVDDLDKVDELLVRLGYESDHFTPTILNEWKWRQYHRTYYHASRKITIEIHWRLSHGPSKEPTFQSLWDRRRTSPLTSNPVFFLGREDLFLYLVCHGARHGWFRLRWLLDIHYFIRQKIDMDKLRSLMGEYQCPQLVGQTLLLASGLLNTPIPGDMEMLAYGKRSRRFAQHSLVYIQEIVDLHNNPPERLDRLHQRYLFSIKTFQQKFLFIISFLYPYQEDALTLRLPKKLHVLYFPLRPFLWIWRKTKKYAVSQGGM